MTKIEFATHTWNPITGCTPVSEGCDNCYARRMAKRLAGRFGYPDSPNEFSVTFHPDKLEQPLHWRKPRVVFVCSMGDLFHEDVPFPVIAKVFATMIAADWHTFLILTKRPKRMAEFVSWFERTTWLYLASFIRHIWHGVTVENQDAMWRVEELLKIPAAKHWVNFEPLLGEIDLSPFLSVVTEARLSATGVRHIYGGLAFEAVDVDQITTRGALSGISVGGESGPEARPMHPDWARGIRDQCVEAGVPFTFKQWGRYAPAEALSENDRIVADSNERWGTVGPEGRYMPLTTPFVSIDLQTGAMSRDAEEVEVYDVSKKAAGRELDGVVWNEWPWDVVRGSSG